MSEMILGMSIHTPHSRRKGLRLAMCGMIPAR